MSRETSEWLNTKTLIGFTKERGHAWHYRAGADNHYPGAIPVEQVEHRLFDFEPVKVETTYAYEDTMGPTGEFIYVNSETHEKICGTTETHKAHGYKEWLIDNVSELIGEGVQIGSAGLLKNDTIAWVQVETEESIYAEGVAFRPTILATTSLDGSVASTYKPVNTIVVCDNTREAAMSENFPSYRVKHTKNSEFNAEVGRKLVGIQLKHQAKAFEEEIKSLVGQSVTDSQLEKFLDEINPIPENEGRGKTMAENRAAQLWGMWTGDPRVSIWKNTAWGVAQLMNTYRQHEAQFKGDNRVESGMMNLVKGDSFRKDAEDMRTLQKVLAGV